MVPRIQKPLLRRQPSVDSLPAAVFIGGLRLWLLAVMATTGLAVAAITARAQEARPETAELPRLEDMQLPSAEELMERFDSDEVFDWIVLNDDSTLVVQPVWPRPETLQKMADEREQLQEARPQTADEREQRNARLEDLRAVELELLNNSAEIYRLPIAQISQIINFEDLMLQRTDQLLQTGEIQKAYELLRRLDSAVPNWDKTVPRFEALLLREAEQREADGNVYAAMALLDELASRNLQNAELPVVFGRIVDAAVDQAVSAADFAQAQYLISRLRRHFPEHEVVTRWTSNLQQRSQSLMSEAAQLAEQRQFDQAAEIARQADQVWSTTGNARATYNQILARHQVIRVAVPRLAGQDVISPVPLDAELRHQELTTVPLFEPAAADELTYFQSGYFEKWDPTDLGRQIVFSLRTTRPYWQTQPVLSANQIADTLSDQLNPELPSFNPRLASFISEFSVRSPTSLQIEFSRVPLNIEALFRFPVVGIPEDERSDPEAEPRVLSSRFQLVDSGPGFRSYQRTIPEPDGLNVTQYHVAELIEQQFDSRHQQIQAFQRGQIDVLPHLQPWEADAFLASGDAFVQKYALPQNHVIVFNPQSEITHSTQLRRALSLSINRDNLLKSIVLRDPEGKYGRVSSAAWHAQSYATSPLVEPPEYNIRLAFALRFAAEETLRIPEKLRIVAEAKAEARKNNQEWDEIEYRNTHAAEIKAAVAHIKLPKLKLLCVPEETALAAAERMVEVWSKIGLDVELIPADQSGETVDPAEWDLMYRTVRLKEPILDLWPLLTSDDSFDVNLLSAYPDWMRQELINLDYAASFLDAQQKLFQIHRHIAAQAFLIPLWEVDDFIAFQRNMSGFASSPLTTYQDVERWAVKP